MALKWEMIKMKVREKTIQYSSKKKRESNEKYVQLEKSQMALETRLATASSSSFNDIKLELNAVKSQMDQIDQEKTKACLLRCKANWINLGEKTTSYFFALEQKNYNRKCISKIRLPSGEIVMDFKTILNEQKSFYESLYRLRELSEEGETNYTFDYLQKIHPDYITKVKEIDRNHLEQKVTIHEIYDAIMTLKSNKTPGSDGYTPEFYRFFWSDIKFIMDGWLQEAIKNEKLHNSARHSVILLLDKPERDLLSLENWRPLSMLTTDYKILAKIIANRLNSVLPYIIHEYQTGFMKNRYISQNITELISIIEYCEEEKLQAIMVSYDFWKAFDSVQWSSLQSILEYFNFGPFFCLLIRILQCEITSVVSNNNHWTSPFKVQQGLRQGCPASPALYNLVMQAVASRVMQNTNIKVLTQQ